MVRPDGVLNCMPYANIVDAVDASFLLVRLFSWLVCWWCSYNYTILCVCVAVLALHLQYNSAESRAGRRDWDADYKGKM